MKTLLGFLSLLIVLAMARAGKREPEFNLNQNDYEIEFERIELVRYNKDYVDISIRTYKFNRTQPAVNATVTYKIDVHSDLKFTVQAYKFMSNEYRYFPMRFGASVCKAIEANTAGVARLKACGNFSTCPFLKDRKYYFCNFYPDQSKLPPFFPNGEFKFEIEIHSHSKEIFVFAVFGTVYRPLKYIP